MSTVFREGMSWAGLVAGPAAWFLAQQGGHLFAISSCGSAASHAAIALNVAALLIALSGASLSWRSHKRYVASPEDGQGKPFLSLFSAFLALLFILIIVAQGAAGLFFVGCER
jgi:hypothetical protein